MLALLSSGARRLYRDDVQRALALPPGAQLLFRYRRGHIEPELQDGRALDRIQPGEQAVIFFADDSCRQGLLPLIPVRSASIISLVSTSDMVWINMELDQFVSCHQFKTFQPAWLQQSPIADNGRITGSWMFRLPKLASDELRLSYQMRVARHTRIALTKCPAFSTTNIFWWVNGVRPVDEDAWRYDVINPLPKQIELDREYELILYHEQNYIAPKSSSYHQLTVQTRGMLDLIDGSTKLIDGPSDIHRWRIVANSKRRLHRGIVEIEGPEGLRADFSLQAKKRSLAERVKHFLMG